MEVEASLSISLIRRLLAFYTALNLAHALQSQSAKSIGHWGIDGRHEVVTCSADRLRRLARRPRRPGSAVVPIGPVARPARPDPSWGRELRGSVRGDRFPKQSLLSCGT